MDTKDTKQQNRRDMMLNEPIHKIIPRMAIPTIVAFLVNSIYSLADTYFVSSLGTNATAAVSVNASLDQMIMMCGSMLAIGANSYIARLLGQGNEKKASQVLSTSFFTAFAIGSLLLIFGNLFMVPMVRLLGATPTCEQYSIDYATYVLFAAPFMASNFVMNQCLRSEGSATLSMVGMGFGSILNCVLDPIFIFYFNMGVAGASLATAISKLVSFAILIFPYITKRSLLRLSIRNVCYSRDIVTNVAAMGSSSLFRNGLAVVAAIMLNDLAGNISDSVLAGIGVCTKIMMFPFSIILGFGSGFQPVAGSTEEYRLFFLNSSLTGKDMKIDAGTVRGGYAKSFTMKKEDTAKIDTVVLLKGSEPFIYGSLSPATPPFSSFEEKKSEKSILGIDDGFSWVRIEDGRFAENYPIIRHIFENINVLYEINKVGYYYYGRKGDKAAVAIHSENGGKNPFKHLSDCARLIGGYWTVGADKKEKYFFSLID